jgi:uncharacterized protein (TIGR02453 family)
MHSILTFLSSLEANNNAEWFHTHQEEYQAARVRFLEIVIGVKEYLEKQDPLLASVDVKKTLFRINRDVRFSKDKSPYKSNFWAVLAPGGTQSRYSCYYIHIQPGNHSFVGGGLYYPEPEIIKYTRDYIQEHFIDFQQLLSTPEFKEHYGFLQGRALTRVPKSYDKDSLAASFLKMKDRYMTRPLKDSELHSPNITTKISGYLETIVPFTTALNKWFMDYDVNPRVTKK